MWLFALATEEFIEVCVVAGGDLKDAWAYMIRCTMRPGSHVSNWCSIVSYISLNFLCGCSGYIYYIAALDIGWIFSGVYFCKCFYVRSYWLYLHLGILMSLQNIVGLKIEVLFCWYVILIMVGRGVFLDWWFINLVLIVCNFKTPNKKFPQVELYQPTSSVVTRSGEGNAVRLIVLVAYIKYKMQHLVLGAFRWRFWLLACVLLISACFVEHQGNVVCWYWFSWKFVASYSYLDLNVGEILLNCLASFKRARCWYLLLWNCGVLRLKYQGVGSVDNSMILVVCSCCDELLFGNYSSFPDLLDSGSPSVVTRLFQAVCSKSKLGSAVDVSQLRGCSSILVWYRSFVC